jgi:predicted Ser/Thr protein kinase
MADMNFGDIIRKDREDNQKAEWNGTLLEYLEIVRSDKFLPKLSHERLHAMNGVR